MSIIDRVMLGPAKKLHTAVRVIRYQRADLFHLLAKNLRPAQNARILKLEAELTAAGAELGRLDAESSCPAPAFTIDRGRVVISVLVAASSDKKNDLLETIESLRWQSTPSWEVIVCFFEEERNGKRRSRPWSRKFMRTGDRITYLPRAAMSRGAALQNAIKQARGDFAIILDAGDLLPKDGIALFGSEIKNYPNSILIYGDEVARKNSGPITIKSNPYWSPETLAAFNYFGRPVAFQSKAVADAGGFVSDLGLATEWDMLLRLTLPFSDKANAPSVRHIPRILCHRLRINDRPSPAVAESAHFRLAAERHWSRKSVTADIKTSPVGIQLATWPIDQWPLVSIVLADVYDAQSLSSLYRSLIQETTDVASEVIIVDYGQQDNELTALYQSIEVAGGLIVKTDMEHGYYHACNRGAAAAQGEILLFIRRGVEFQSKDWLSPLVRYAVRPGAGVVAPRIKPSEQHEFSVPENPRCFSSPCQIIRRTVFRRIGGYDESFKMIYGDAAMSLQASAFGFRNIKLEQVVAWHRNHAPESVRDDAVRLALQLDALGGAKSRSYSTEFEEIAVLPKESANQLCEAFEESEILNLFNDRTISHCVGKSAADLIVEADGDLPISDVPTAVRLIVTLLMRFPSLRGRFPTALSDGVDGEFARWLLDDDETLLGLKREEKTMIRRAFEADLPKRGRQVAFYDEALRTSEPLFLLPEGRDALAATLFTAFASGILTLEEVWWTLLQSAESAGSELVQTWLYTPEWQAKFPNGLNVAGKDAVSQWVRDRFDTSAKFLDKLSWPLKSVPAAAALDENEFDGKDQSPVGSVINGVNVFAHFTYPSGLRASAEGLVESLKTQSVPLSLRNVPVNLSWDEPKFERFNGLERYDVSVIHVQPEPYFSEVFVRAGLQERDPKTYRIGYWYWESEDIPAEWDLAASKCDELWTATSFVSNALKSRYSKPVHILPPGFQIPEFRPRSRAHFGLPEGPFMFLFVFHMTSAMQRKNPLGLIEAFRAAFDSRDDVMLVIKTTYGSDHPAELASLRTAASGFPIYIVDGVYDRSETLSLINACDCYISLHRSEGLGLTMIEAMQLAKPTIATGYSGNIDFMNDANSLLVDHRVVTLESDLPNYRRGLRWAQPSVDHAVAQMRYVFNNRDAASKLGLRGQADLQVRMGHRKAGAAMVRRLAEL